MGFPKYRAEVSLTSDGNDWQGVVQNDGGVDFRASFANACRAQDVFPWPDFINLTPIPSGETAARAFVPPRDGRALMVPAEYLVDPAYYSLQGDIRIEIGDDLPWDGLFDEGQPLAGHLVRFKGGIDLGNRPLD